jgi:hypothetical protein
MTNYIEYIEQNTIRCEAGYRGGGIEIDLEPLTGGEDHAMTAYQNYLGGGMLGSICNSYSFDLDRLSKRNRVKVERVTEALNRYFHDLTNHEDDEWESTSYERGQLRPQSAY